MNLKHFTYEELNNATNQFEEELGRGASAIVFKGVLAFDNGKSVAVKSLDTRVRENDLEFKAEVSAIGRTNHRASSLESRCQTGIKNILLDDSLTARISDFGLAKLLIIDQTLTMTGIRGTKGYVAPEWLKRLPITAKVDIYSYGILLLEIIFCRKHFEAAAEDEDQMILADWAYDYYKQNELHQLLKNDDEAMHDMKEMEKYVMIAIWCIQEDVENQCQPKTIKLSCILFLFNRGSVAQTYHEESHIDARRNCRSLSSSRSIFFHIRVEQLSCNLLFYTPKMQRSSSVLALHPQGLHHKSSRHQIVRELELEKWEVVGEILKLNPSCKTPLDYKPLFEEAIVPIPIGWRCDTKNKDNSTVILVGSLLLSSSGVLNFLLPSRNYLVVSRIYSRKVKVIQP
ncbi:hypothetical protein DVH24_041982 [Malus domestica]|uniref:Protein kinase domain-containing protein n=1 Tax=Malus domestica TaxID=3750 RepID=A0A498ISQ1_MALDO|nr:hypothetical protein DVH24_041982 [Malus domestica]